MGLEPRISGVGSDRSTNWATTTANNLELLRAERGLKIQVLFQAAKILGDIFFRNFVPGYRDLFSP